MATWSLIQTNSIVSPTYNVDIIQLAFTSPPATGNLLVATYLAYGTVSTQNLVLTDNYNSGNWSGLDIPLGAESGQIFWRVPTSTGTSFTITGTANTYLQTFLNIYEFKYGTGSATYSVDSHGSNYDTSATTSISLASPLTVTAGPDLIITGFSGDAASTVTPPTGFTANTVQPVTFYCPLASAAYYMAESSNINPTFTLGTAVAWGIVGAAFAATGGGPSGGLFSPATLSLGSGGPFFMNSVNG